MGILEGKKLVVTGVLTDASLAFSVAQLAIEQGADVMLTGAGTGPLTHPPNSAETASRGSSCRVRCDR
jgi:enoyl-[acyl-carrier-protein] reductase (NADH)